MSESKSTYADGARLTLDVSEITVNADRNYSRYYAPSDRTTKELATAIAAEGQIQEVVVRPVKDKLELVVGFRRVAAFGLIPEGDRPRVRAIVRKLTDKQAALMNVGENVEREDQSPIDQAFAIQQLMELGIARKEIASRFKRSNPWITLTLRLLDLQEDVMTRVHTGEIPVNAAHEIAKLPHNEQVIMAREHVPGLGLPEGSEAKTGKADPKAATRKARKKVSRKRGSESGGALKRKARKAAGKSNKMTLRDFRKWLEEIHGVAGHGVFEGQLAYSVLRLLDGADEDGAQLYEFMSCVQDSLQKNFPDKLAATDIPLWSAEKERRDAEAEEKRLESERRAKERKAKADAKKKKPARKKAAKKSTRKRAETSPDNASQKAGTKRRRRTTPKNS